MPLRWLTIFIYSRRYLQYTVETCKGTPVVEILHLHILTDPCPMQMRTAATRIEPGQFFLAYYILYMYVRVYKANIPSV